MIITTIGEPYLLVGSFTDQRAKTALLRHWSAFMTRNGTAGADVELNPDLSPWHFCFDSVTGRVQVGPALFTHIERRVAEGGGR